MMEGLKHDHPSCVGDIPRWVTSSTCPACTLGDSYEHFLKFSIIRLLYFLVDALPRLWTLLFRY